MKDTSPANPADSLRDLIVPLTIIVVILAILACELSRGSPAAQPGSVIPRILALSGVGVLFSVFPALPLLYGWYYRNRTGAVLAGILPLPLFFLGGFFLQPAGDPAHLVYRTIPYIVVLAAILGLAGYCAAHRTREYLAVSFVLTGLWLVCFLSGFT